jgi:Cu-Zn family superoxide dismutase
MNKIIFILFFFASATVFADEITVPMNLVTADGVGKNIGTVIIKPAAKGITLTPNLEGLAPGEHGFHVHTNPDCGPAPKEGAMSAAEKAGAHYDPKDTKKHEGPHGNGHLGDLPFLTFNADGKATTAVSTELLTLSDIKGHSLMIHENGDNYSDTPKPLGGGGKRVACGVVPK